MHGTKRRIAVLNGVDDDAHTDQIVDVREIMAAHDHLLVDGEVILRASGDVCLDVLLVEILVDLRQNLLQMAFIPSRLAKGAYTSRVSRAFFWADVVFT